METFSKNATPWKVAPKVGSLKPHAGRRAVHSVPDTLNTRCDGCPELTVKQRDWAKHERYGYYCGKLARELTRKEIYDMSKKECPLHVDLRKRRFAE